MLFQAGVAFARGLLLVSEYVQRESSTHSPGPARAASW